LTAKAAFENARLVYQQDATLYHEGYVSQAALELARSSYVQAQSVYETATIGIRNNVVAGENVKASVASAQSALAQAHLLQAEIAQTYLYAPYDGVITARLMDPGSQAGPSAPILAISRVNTVWINVNVPDEDLPYVTPGKLLAFQSDSLPGRTFRGRVSTVNAVPTAGTLSYLARLDLPNPGNLLRGGMLVNVVITRAAHRHATVVPRSAIAQTDQGTFVYVVRNAVASQVSVKLGLQTDTLSEVMSPKVQPGTVVITTRPDALHDGSAVAVSGSPAP
jgi:membrane fusion protein (multidrug efflux system)